MRIIFQNAETKELVGIPPLLGLGSDPSKLRLHIGTDTYTLQKVETDCTAPPITSPKDLRDGFVPNTGWHRF